MIAQLEGRLVCKSPDEVVIEVNGVGYGLCVSLTTFYRLPEVGERVLLQVYTHVREDALLLYGFLDREEKNVFKLLLGVSKIGPRLARNILSGLSAAELAQAISAGDVGKISAIPGVGRKTVERMVIELRDKVGAVDPTDLGAYPEPSSQYAQESDAVSALVNLGYKKAAAQRVVKRVLAQQEDLPLEGLIKEVLQQLS